MELLVSEFRLETGINYLKQLLRYLAKKIFFEIWGTNAFKKVEIILLKRSSR